MLDTPAAPPAPDLVAAQDALAAEWRSRNPTTPDEIAQFYRETTNYGADLAAWHATPERRSITAIVVHTARAIAADRVVDIGCGAGHDLLALRAASPDVHLEGVEPNAALRRTLDALPGIRCFPEEGGARIAAADLLVCIDVLEHVVDPESFLAGIAQRARVGCCLVEATASWDAATPLHLAANRGWHPGRVLERHGWSLVDTAGDPPRVRVWRRDAEAGPRRAALLLCAYRNVTVQSLRSILSTAAGRPGWRVKVKDGDALISRSRSILLTDWWRATADDVALMIDDDIAFTAADAERVVALCRERRGVVCGAYPVRDGAHLALQYLPGTVAVHFHPDEGPVEIKYAATGFMAVHRAVLDALIADMPLLHPREVWSFYPLFPTMTVDDPAAGPVLLSEDWAFSELARRAGFTIRLDPGVRLRHASTVPISIANMAAVNAAIKHA